MLKQIILAFVLVPFLFFVLVNVYASQNLPPLFFRLTTRLNRADAVVFLKKIAKTDYFADQSAVFQHLYGNGVARALEAESDARADQIQKLEAVLEKNPQARDVLLKLALLHLEDDDRSKAETYYRKAKTIDPEVMISQLPLP